MQSGTGLGWEAAKSQQQVVLGGDGVGSQDQGLSVGPARRSIMAMRSSCSCEGVDGGWAARGSHMLLLWRCQMSVKNVFIRGSVVRYIQIPASEVDVQVSGTNATTVHQSTRHSTSSLMRQSSSQSGQGYSLSAEGASHSELASGGSQASRGTGPGRVWSALVPQGECTGAGVHGDGADRVPCVMRGVLLQLLQDSARKELQSGKAR